VTTAYKNNPLLSVRDVAKRYGIPKTTVGRIKEKCSLRTYKKYKKPNRDQIQNFKAKSRSRKLYDNFLRKRSCIMDDETYCKADFQQLPGQSYYTQLIRTNISNNYKLAG
jgi:hypothetical protein